MIRVDRVSMICKTHDVCGCEVCMVDDYYDWIDDRKERRRRYKREWQATPIVERFEIGGCIERFDGNALWGLPDEVGRVCALEVFGGRIGPGGGELF